MRRALVALAAAATLTACGGGDEKPRANSTASETSSSTATRTTTPKATRTSSTPPPAPQTPSPEAEANVVATVTAKTFNDNREALSTELVKSSGLIEAQTDFRFDEPAQTLVLAGTTLFETGDARVAYRLATNLAPVFLGPEPDSVRPESLAFFSVTADSSLFVCDGPTMAALADRELSDEMVVQRCAR